MANLGSVFNAFLNVLLERRFSSERLSEIVTSINSLFPPSHTHKVFLQNGYSMSSNSLLLINNLVLMNPQMKAAVMHGPGGPEVLKLEEVSLIVA